MPCREAENQQVATSVGNARDMVDSMVFIVRALSGRVVSIPHWVIPWVLLWLVIGLTDGAMAQTPLPEPSDIEQRLAELQPEEGVTQTDAALRDIEALEAVLADLQAYLEFENRLVALNESVEKAPTQLLRLERELLDEEEADLNFSATDLDELTLEELEMRQQEAVLELQQLQERLARSMPSYWPPRPHQSAPSGPSPRPCRPPSRVVSPWTNWRQEG
jgi:hypothetical protein